MCSVRLLLDGEFVRVVKESDSKSDGLCPHRFESCGPRSFLYFQTILADIDSYSNHATDLQNKLGQLKTSLMDQGWL